ncbi:hypothetical protein GCM10018779_52090 [Streptomyces griseocarneus]|nr:hypothetical protein GCM10018779_52090 [Streptomyces griseocarneus]
MPRYEGLPDIRSSFEDERRRGGCLKPISCLAGLTAMTFLLLMLAAGCEMVFGTGEGSSGHARIISTNDTGSCVIRLASKSYNALYRTASGTASDQCLRNVGHRVIVHFDSLEQITRIKPAS